MQNDFNSLFNTNEVEKFKMNLNKMKHDKVLDSQSKKDNEIAQLKLSYEKDLEKSVHNSNCVEYDTKNDNTVKNNDLFRLDKDLINKDSLEVFDKQKFLNLPNNDEDLNRGKNFVENRLSNHFLTI